MSAKKNQIPKNEPAIVAEPLVAYQTKKPKVSSSNEWNPNVPGCYTQEEWWDHFHRIEEGKFTPLDIANKEFEAWKKEYLAYRM